MPTEPSVHDNRIIAYHVLAKEERIIMETEYSGRESHEFTDIIFEGVLAYYFENDIFETIIADLEEVDLSTLLKEYAAIFETSWRYGWPRGWDKRKEEIEVFVRRQNMRAFKLWASYGMTGWVMAERMVKTQKVAADIQSAGRVPNSSLENSKEPKKSP